MGLSLPSVNVPDGGTYRANDIQRRLYYLWQEYWREVLAYTQGYYRLWVLGGDTLDLDIKRRSHQYITNDESAALDHAERVLETGMEAVDACVFLIGTGAHVGINGAFEKALAGRYDHVIKTKDGEAAWWQFQRKINGVQFDIAHHTSMGSTPRTEKNAANQLARDTRDWYDEVDQRPPDIVIRGHVHRMADSYDNCKTRAIILPGWQGKTEYAHRRNSNRPPDIGGIAVLCHGIRDYEVKKWKLPLTTGSLWADLSLPKRTTSQS